MGRPKHIITPPSVKKSRAETHELPQQGKAGAGIANMAPSVVGPATPGDTPESASNPRKAKEYTCPITTLP